MAKKIANTFSPETTSSHQTENDDWSLTVEQRLFMMQHNNEIEIAFEEDDMQSLRTLAEGDIYLSLFGDMSFDEAYDRYECALEDGAVVS